MLKLNENYSDYVDMDDVNYPEGKAVNASSSESFDGTPLLASFMNDVNAAHIAMYEKAYGNRDGIDGEADSQKASQFADAVAKYTDDKVSDHVGKRGLADGVHGATSEASAGQIATRDENGNLKVGTPIEGSQAANKDYVDTKAPIDHASPETSYGVASASNYGHAKASSTTPKANGTAAVGTETGTFARGDHVHPLQTSVSGSSGSCTGNAATATRASNSDKADALATSRNIDGVSFNGSASIVHWGTCDTAAATQAKVVSCAGFSLAAGSRITVKFTNGNTSGSVKGNTTTNIIPQASAPTMNVNGTGAKQIKVGGEFAGEGFINAGDVHDFVYDGTFWNDVTADVIYQGGDATNGYYVKKRNGLIEQSGVQKYVKSVTGGDTGEGPRIVFPIIYEELSIVELTHGLGNQFNMTVSLVDIYGFSPRYRNINNNNSASTNTCFWFARGY